MQKAKKLLASKKGEGYFEIAIAVVVFVLVAVVMINIYSFFVLKSKMDAAANQLIDYATYTGSFGDGFEEAIVQLKESNPDFANFTISYSAEKWHDSALKTVQYGDKMTVVVSCVKVLDGGGIVKFDIPCSVIRSGLSRANFKGQKTLTPAEGEESTDAP